MKESTAILISAAIAFCLLSGCVSWQEQRLQQISSQGGYSISDARMRSEVQNKPYLKSKKFLKAQEVDSDLDTLVQDLNRQ